MLQDKKLAEAFGVAIFMNSGTSFMYRGKTISGYKEFSNQ